jgi:hypothetical protein
MLSRFVSQQLHFDRVLETLCCAVTAAPAALVTMQYWGGGVFCGSNFKHLPMPTADCLIPTANGTMVTAKCFNAETAPKCTNNGDVKLPFGSPPYIGMGFMVSLFIALHCWTLVCWSVSLSKLSIAGVCAASSKKLGRALQCQVTVLAA